MTSLPGRVSLLGVGLLFSVAVSCKKSTASVSAGAGSAVAAPATSATVAVKVRRAPIEPPPPFPERAVSAQRDAQLLVNEKAYLALWEPAKKADLVLLLTGISDALNGATKNPKDSTNGKYQLTRSLTEQLKWKKLDTIRNRLMDVSLATGSFPTDFVTRVQAVFASGNGLPHEGLWKPYSSGQPFYDYSTLAYALNPENATYLREMLLSRHGKGGPFGWLSAPALRPWLCREGAALQALANLGSLLPEEQLRMGQILASPLGDDPGMSVEWSDLTSAYKTNEVRADTNYKGNIVTVSGVANEIRKDPSGGVYIIMNSNWESEYRGVRCNIAPLFQERASKVDKGDNIELRGRVKGLSMSLVIVENCEFSHEE
jgi:tRNA_anti-like